MKYLINIAIVILIGVLAYALYTGINEPIKFKAQKTKRERAVVEKLKKIRTLQEFHKEITGQFAGDFNQLKNTLMKDSFQIVSLEPDPSDPENPDLFVKTVTKVPARDTLAKMNINLDNLAVVPYSDNNSTFSMKADTTSYQSVTVPVVECYTKYNEFMGEFSDPKYQMYVSDYEPARKIGFGSLSSPNLEGNWK